MSISTSIENPRKHLTSSSREGKGRVLSAFLKKKKKKRVKPPSPPYTPNTPNTIPLRPTFEFQAREHVWLGNVLYRDRDRSVPVPRFRCMTFGSMPRCRVQNSARAVFVLTSMDVVSRKYTIHLRPDLPACLPIYFLGLCACSIIATCVPDPTWNVLFVGAVVSSRATRPVHPDGFHESLSLVCVPVDVAVPPESSVLPTLCVSLYEALSTPHPAFFPTTFPQQKLVRANSTSRSHLVSTTNLQLRRCRPARSMRFRSTICWRGAGTGRHPGKRQRRRGKQMDPVGGEREGKAWLVYADLGW